MTTAVSELKNILLIVFGSAILAFGVSAFLLPAKVATGGTPGTEGSPRIFIHATPQY